MIKTSDLRAIGILSCPIPHPRSFFRELWWSLRRHIKFALGLKRKALTPVLSQPLEQIVARHAWICDVLREWLPPSDQWHGKPACEAGAGDCLAAASMILGLGASRVTIIEGEPPVIGQKQAAVLDALRQRGYPCDKRILTSEHKLNTDKCVYIQSHMENYIGLGDCSLAYSICVCEHVEELGGFFVSCGKALVEGGQMMHYIDLGGHGIFEDPMPPLEFHRYSDLLYSLIYPRHFRATRRFVSDYVHAASQAGFVDIATHPVRRADMNYISQLRPFLKSRAIDIPDDELAVVEFVLTATFRGRPIEGHEREH